MSANLAEAQVDYFDVVERGVEMAEEWKPSAEDAMRSGRVELWKLIRPKDRPDEPVWLMEVRNRNGRLWSKYVSQVALVSKLTGIGIKGLSKAQQHALFESADPATFPARIGSFIAVKWGGEHPHPERPGARVTRWTVSIATPETISDSGGTPTDGEIPF